MIDDVLTSCLPVAAMAESTAASAAARLGVEAAGGEAAPVDASGESNIVARCCFSSSPVMVAGRARGSPPLLFLAGPGPGAGGGEVAPGYIVYTL